MWSAIVNNFLGFLAVLAGAVVCIVQLAHLVGFSIAYRSAVDIAAVVLNLESELPAVLWSFLGSIAPIMISILWFRIARSLGWKSLPLRLVAALITGYYLLSGILLAYRYETGVAFDPSLLLHHLDDSIRTISVLSNDFSGLFLALILLLALHYHGLVLWLSRLAMVEPSRLNGGVSRLFGVGLLGVFAASWVSQISTEQGVGGLMQSFFEGNSNVQSIYGQYFKDSIERNKIQKVTSSSPVPPTNLFMFQLESLNAQLIEEGYSPRFVTTARERGVFYPRIQSASVFTILAMETILCSVLPPLEKNIAQIPEIYNRLSCLPKILKAAGYRTLYFQSFPDLNYTNNEAFLRGIGFDEVNSGAIMKPGAPQLKWGYPEDVFYKGVFDYLERFKGEKLFVYILTCSTNHYPFYDDEKSKFYPQLATSVPYPQAKNDRQRMANTTWIQDRFFGQMYDELFVPRYANSSHAVVLGDHSWPIEIHKGNHHNLNLAYEENFVTSLSILPARGIAGEPYQKGKVVAERRSHLDIVPTILEMYGLGRFNYYGSSFVADFSAGAASAAHPRCVVSAQPFSGGYIAITRFPMKHIFNLKKKTVSVFDLGRDPDEMNPIRESPLDSEQLTLLEHCLSSLRDAQPPNLPSP